MSTTASIAASGTQAHAHVHTHTRGASSPSLARTTSSRASSTRPHTSTSTTGDEDLSYEDVIYQIQGSGCESSAHLLEGELRPHDDADAGQNRPPLSRKSTPVRNHRGYWNRSKSALTIATSSSEIGESKPKFEPEPKTPCISKTEFEALPPAIQRKYFSELELQKLVRSFGFSPAAPKRPTIDSFGRTTPERSTTEPTLTSSKPQPTRGRVRHRPSYVAEPHAPASRRRIHISLDDSLVASALPEKIRNRYLSESERLLANRRAHSATPGSLDEDQSQPPRPQTRAGLLGHHEANMSTNNFYDTFRWLDDDATLDLRLGFDDYHATSREVSQDIQPQPIQPQLGRRPSFRHRLSMNKLPFVRSSSANASRPGTKDTVTGQHLPSAPSPAPTKPDGHERSKSRALSLISLNKQSARSTPQPVDYAAAYYQDPEARLKLKEYSAPQKFDEALEYGFPSLGDTMAPSRAEPRESDDYKLGIFLDLDDDKSSTYSNHSTVSDPDSPKTPPLMERPMDFQPTRAYTDPMPSSNMGLASGPLDNPREMTMRMTLTRPDLRANEDQIYGWQNTAPVRKVHMRSESMAPAVPEKDSGITDMEKHFADLDQENDSAADGSVVKRFWKRVRRN